MEVTRKKSQYLEVLNALFTLYYFALMVMLLFLESAGAVSVHMHILSPSSNRLFGRAISQSGTALNLFATNTHAEVTAQSKRFAGKFGCPIKNTKEMVECLKALDATTLVSAHIESLVCIDLCIEFGISIILRIL